MKEPTDKEVTEMAAQIAIASMDTIKFEGTPKEMQSTADAWAKRSWNLAATFFMACPFASEAPPLSEEDLSELKHAKKRASK